MSKEPCYFDVDGKEISLDALCMREPAWAANRIRVMRGLLDRCVKYAREDRMVTPGMTRLARLLEKYECETKCDDTPEREEKS